jgi:hypothetical protein
MPKFCLGKKEVFAQKWRSSKAEYSQLILLPFFFCHEMISGIWKKRKIELGAVV